MTIRIEFDGGTSNNVPSRGPFGDGYGSYKIDNGPIHRCYFRRPMSANSAELYTLEAAVNLVIATYGMAVSETSLHIVGDSTVALGWASRKPRKLKMGSTPVFREAAMRVRFALRDFKKITVEWQPRHKSVVTFGH